MGEIFKKSDIKAGYLLKVKDTDEDREFYMTVMPTRENTPSFLAAALLGAQPIAAGELACCNPGKDWWPLSNFDDELTSMGWRRVVAVYGYTTPKCLLDNSPDNRELLWERETVETSDEEEAEETRPAPINCKVVCISNTVAGSATIPDFTVGKVYEVKDGRITNDTGWTSRSYGSLSDLSTAMGNQFIEFVE